MTDYTQCPIIIHGSQDSLDVDAYMIVPRPLEKKEGQELAKQYPELNISFLTIEDGRVTWAQKGIADECNNSLLATYGLHKQDFACPVEIKVPRQYAVKMLHTVRGLLTHCSRTQYRDQVKTAISSVNFMEKIEALESIDLTKITGFDKKTPIETYKFMAFQIGQTYSLVKDHLELFTKKDVAHRFPELEPYLYRKETSVDALQGIWREFTEFLKQECKQVARQDLFHSDFGNGLEVWHAKKEVILPPVAVFDVDGTLLDESHRAHLREGSNADWVAYFKACVNDTPIQKIVDLTKLYKENGYEVWIMTGRSDIVEAETIKSLKDAGVQYDYLKMRGENNKMKDYVLKAIWMDKYIGLERIKVIFDDREPVIASLRKKGLNVIDVTAMDNYSFEANTVPGFLKVNKV